MNILLIDDDLQIKIIFDTLVKLEKEWTVYQAETLQEATNIYTKNQIDLLVIDFSLEENDKILKDLIEKNPKLKTITLSENLQCSITLGCETCQKEFKRKRLLKPISAKLLLQYIKEFDLLDCKYFNTFNNSQYIKELIPEIIQRYVSCEYVHEENYIVFNSNRINDIYDFCDILVQHNINFEILENNQVKIVS